MKNILLSVVVICALVTGGLSGTLADFSDVEISDDNYFATGALDLVVSDYLGTEFPTDAPVFYEVLDAWPCCDKSVFLDLHNYGQGFQKTPYIYLHVKNLECGWVMPKAPYAWLDEDGEITDPPDPLPNEGTFGTGYPRPVTEPEYVAEMGGIAGELADGTPVVVEGMGEYGEGCQVGDHVGIMIWVAGPYEHDQYPTSDTVPTADWMAVDLSAYDANDDGVIKLGEIECVELLLGQIPNCNKLWVHISAHLQDFDEEDAYDEGLISQTYFGEDFPEAKWDHWPTNAYQKDYMMFDMAFELLQNRVPTGPTT